MTTRPDPPIIGLVGGIASGKSTLARWVAAQHPVLVIDADALGHAALRYPGVQARLRETFGEAVIGATGEINRRALADRVFGGTDAQEQARRQLEAIVHPWIEQAMLDQVRHADPAIQAVLLDAAVLLEAGWQRHCTAIVFVDTPDHRRENWAREQRGWTADELRRRAASQWPLDQKRAEADWEITNDGTVERGGEQLWELVREVVKKRNSLAG